MDYLYKRFTLHKLTHSSKLNSLHNQYKNCVAKEVENFMKGSKVNSEVCLEEKQKFYNALHEANKLEHDNIENLISRVFENLQS